MKIGISNSAMCFRHTATSTSQKNSLQFETHWVTQGSNMIFQLRKDVLLQIMIVQRQPPWTPCLKVEIDDAYMLVTSVHYKTFMYPKEQWVPQQTSSRHTISSMGRKNK